MLKINYVLSTWNGKRRSHGHPVEYLQRHVKQLNSLKHNLSQITVVVPDSSCDTPEYVEFINSLKEPYVVIRRPNEGLSYGSFSEVFDCYGETFDYYIFMEDDYHFVKDSFDQILVNMFERAKCGYLCGYVKEAGVYPLHAGNTIGITSTKILGQIKKRFGKIPYAVSEGRGAYFQQGGQVKFGQAFIELGYSLADTTHRFKSPFYATSQLREYAPAQKEYLFVPDQILDKVVSSL